jgi:deoxycytidine triphosphate deaminase
MSTLTIHELKHLAKNNNLLGNNYSNVNFQPSSYDLRIGTIFRQGIIYSNDFQPENFTNNIDIKPSEIVSMLTLEKVTIPNNCIGTVFAVNKHSSTGLLILNPGHIDPGYSGHISICAINLSNEVKTLSIGDPIFSLIIQKLNDTLTEEDLYQNKNYQNRKEEEQIFLKEKSRKLSNSFFDLVINYEGAKKMLGKELLQLFWKIFGMVGGFLANAAAIAGILALLYVMLPDHMPIIKKPQDNKNDSSRVNQLEKIIKEQRQQIELLKDTNKISTPK